MLIFSAENDSYSSDDSDVEIQLDSSSMVSFENKKLRISTTGHEGNDENSSGFQKWRQMQDKMRKSTSSRNGLYFILLQNVAYSQRPK